MGGHVAEYVRQVLERNDSFISGALDGLSLDDVHHQPGPDSNSIAWLVWHLARVQDNHVSAMADKQHVWLTEGWVDRFALGLEPLDRGRGHTSEQAAALRVPSIELLLDYYRAVRAATGTFLDGLADEDLARQVPAIMGDGTVPLSERLQHVIFDCLHHTGQVAYLRGLYQGRGWLSI